MAMTRKTMGEYLLEKGLITREQLEDALKIQQATGKPLEQILVDQTLVSERDAYEAKAYEMGMPFVDLDRVTPEPSAVNVVKEHIAKRYNVMPVKKEGNILYLAMADPNNVMAIDDVRVNSRCVVRPVLAAPGAIQDAIAKAYGGSAVAATDGAPAGGGEGGAIAPRPTDLRASVMTDVAAYSARGDAEEDEKHHHPAGNRRARQRYPCGTPGAQCANPIPHRRRPARSAHFAQICSGAAHLPL